VSADELPAVLVRMLALWNGGAIDPAEVYAAPADDLVPTVAGYRAAFPDLRWVVDEWFAAGDRYVLRMHATGTHTGDPFESEIGTAEATGEPFTMQGIEVLEIRDDRIVDGWQVWDMGALYAALGARVGPNASR
jgi:ketosteroid isomerase-like protein